MPQYQLNVGFTNDQLEILYMTGSNVIIAKPAGGNNPNVAWQVFKPMQANTVTWEEQYGIYTSTSSVENGATLTQMSNTGIPATEGQIYTLQDSGVISNPSSGGTTGAFTLVNDYSNKPYMTVGLYQDATVNGTQIIGNALSAAPVLLKSTAVMTPYTIVYIWLQSQVKSNTVVTTVTSPMTKLTFGGGTNTLSVAYDSGTGTFIPASTSASTKALTSKASSTKALTEDISIIEPSL